MGRGTGAALILVLYDEIHNHVCIGQVPIKLEQIITIRIFLPSV